LDITYIFANDIGVIYIVDNLEDEVMVEKNMVPVDTEKVLDKQWLFQENVRIENEKKKLDADKKEFAVYQKDMERKLSFMQRQIDTEKSLFDQKLKILQSAYQQLELDRKAVEKDKRMYHMNREYEHENTVIQYVSIHSFFKGVDSMLALKKRYKDLLKIFHPDNLCGDKDTVQMINKEYQILQEKYLDCVKSN